MDESQRLSARIENLRKEMNWPEDGPLPGQTLDLNSSATEIEFCTELPFWLLTPKFGYAVQLDTTTVDLSINHDYVELQRGQAYRPSGEAIFYVGDLKSHNPDKDAVVRHLRTVVSFRPSVPLDAVDALTSEISEVHFDLTTDEEIDIPAYTATLKKRESQEYFQVLAIAYLQFINKFVDTYRRLACDPFAHSVSLWDVPQWFIKHGERFGRIHAVPYSQLDTYPYVTKFSRDAHRPVVLTTPEKLAIGLANEPFPGELDMHDAWNHFYCGRYNDAVRTAVTAIEVVLEECLRRALVARKNSPEEVQARLRRTFNDFEARLQDYSHVTKRAMPGPILSIIPYINGVRLRQEIEAARQLRHKVVHEALRIDIVNRGPLQRIVETLSWTFEWFVNDENHQIRPSHPYGLLALWAGGQKRGLNFEYHATGVTIFDESARHKKDEIPIADDALYDQLSLAISPQTTDTEKFAAMAGEYLQFPAVFTADAPEIRSPFVQPRLLFVDPDGLSRAVFCFDSASGIRRGAGCCQGHVHVAGGKAIQAGRLLY